jgi:hypothetical protein
MTKQEIRVSLIGHQFMGSDRSIVEETARKPYAGIR